MTDNQLKKNINDITLLIGKRDNFEYTQYYHDKIKSALFNDVFSKSKGLHVLFLEQSQYDAYISNVVAYLCDGSIPVSERKQVFSDVKAGYLVGGLA